MNNTNPVASLFGPDESKGLGIEIEKVIQINGIWKLSTNWY